MDFGQSSIVLSSIVLSSIVTSSPNNKQNYLQNCNAKKCAENLANLEKLANLAKLDGTSRTEKVRRQTGHSDQTRQTGQPALLATKKTAPIGDGDQGQRISGLTEASHRGKGPEVGGQGQNWTSWRIVLSSLTFAF
jgi:hypothetical protein